MNNTRIKQALATLKGFPYKKQHYDGLPEPKFGIGVKGNCIFCGFDDLYLSGTEEDPEEIFGEVVRCRVCGRINSRDYRVNI